MNELAVTDAHALIWVASGRLRKLGRDARRIFERSSQGNATVYVPTVALVEVGEALHAGRIPGGSSLVHWVNELFASSVYVPADLTREIVMRAETLYGIPERTDRLIAATARELGLPLITRDPAIRRIAGIETIW